MIDQLQKDFEQPNTTERLAYFYCNRAEENRRSPESILNALVHQLAQCDGDKIAKAVADIFSERQQKGQLTAELSLHESEDLLIKLTDVHLRTTICVDALDEVNPERRIQLLEALKRVMDESKNLVKIFATSRNDPDILCQFEVFPRIDLKSEDNASDIRRFIDSRVAKAVRQGRLRVDDSLQLEICTKLRACSEGMWVVSISSRHT